jgi:ABC-type transport system involved in multi-copper enzyme maturation permease subunit
MVIALSFFTFGIYPFIWLVKTKNEMNRYPGVYIYPAWYLLIPFLNLYWLWLFAKGVSTVTNRPRNTNAIEIICYILFLWCFGMAVIQSDLNKVPSPPKELNQTDNID